MDNWTLGTVVTLDASFVVGAVPTDPDVVTLTLRPPTGWDVTDDVIVHDGPGEYHCDYTPNLLGVWRYRWLGTGAAAGATEGEFEITTLLDGPATAYYSTPAKVLVRTGTDPSDLGLDTDEELTEFVADLLEEITDLMNQKLGRDYCALLDDGRITAIPKGLAGIAADIGADCLRTMVATRGSSVVRIDDFAVATVRARVFSEDILERLRLYGHHGVRSVSMSNR